MLKILELEAILAPDVPIEEATKIIANEARLFLDEWPGVPLKTRELADRLCVGTTPAPPGYNKLKRILNWLAKHDLAEYTFKSREAFMVRGRYMRYVKWRGKLTQPEAAAEKPNMAAVDAYWKSRGKEK